MTKPTGKRLTERRVAELFEAIAEVRAELGSRVGLLEDRVDAGELLAEELGQAALRTLQRSRRPPRPAKGATL